MPKKIPVRPRPSNSIGTDLANITNPQHSMHGMAVTNSVIRGPYLSMKTPPTREPAMLVMLGSDAVGIIIISLLKSEHVYIYIRQIHIHYTKNKSNNIDIKQACVSLTSARQSQSPAN